MSKPILDFAAIRSIAQRLSPAEVDLNGAIAANAELIATIIRAGRPMNISPMMTHGIVATLSQANADLVAGMGRTIEAHTRLAGLRDQLGLRAIAFGGGMWKGELMAAETSGTQDAPAQLVASA